MSIWTEGGKEGSSKIFICKVGIHMILCMFIEQEMEISMGHLRNSEW